MVLLCYSSSLIVSTETQHIFLIEPLMVGPITGLLWFHSYIAVHKCANCAENSHARSLALWLAGRLAGPSVVIAQSAFALLYAGAT